MFSNLSGLDLASAHTIRLWDPYPNLGIENELRGKDCLIGAVGKFNKDGRFDVRFNILMSKEENIRMNYDPPPDFEPFPVTGSYDRIKPVSSDVLYISEDIRREGTENGYWHSFFYPFMATHGNTFSSKQAYTLRSTRKPDSYGAVALILPQGCEIREILERLHRPIENYLNDLLGDWFNQTGSHDLRNGSWKLVVLTYRSTIWASAGLHRENYKEERRPQVKLTQQNQQNDTSREWYKWEDVESFRISRSCNEVLLEDFPCTVGAQMMAIRSTERFAQRVTKTTASLASKLSLGHRTV